MCTKWPCCEESYTVRRYHPDGRTAWVRNYGLLGSAGQIPTGDIVGPPFLDATLHAPIDVAVGADGRVFVAGPHCIAGNLAWDLRCYSAEGDTLWFFNMLPIVQELTAQPFALGVGIREIDVDGADNLYVLTRPAFGGNIWGRIVFKFSKDGELLFTNIYSEVNIGFVIDAWARLAVAADGAWLVTPDQQIISIRIFWIHDAAIVAPGRFVAAGSLLSAIHGELVLVDPSDYEIIDEHSSMPLRIARGIASNENGLMVVKDGATDGDRIAQYSVNAAAIGGVNWSRAARVRDQLGGIDMNRSMGRTAVLLRGEFDEAIGDAHRRWPSLAVLNVGGNVVWSHFHHDRVEVSIGEDGSVATIGAPLVRGRREWDYLNALGGV